jgi:hypothetical protein
MIQTRATFVSRRARQRAASPVGWVLAVAAGLLFGFCSNAVERQFSLHAGNLLALIGGVVAGHFTISLGVVTEREHPRTAAGVLCAAGSILAASLMQWGGHLHDYGILLASRPGGAAYIVSAVVTTLIYWVGAKGNR